MPRRPLRAVAIVVATLAAGVIGAGCGSSGGGGAATPPPDAGADAPTSASCAAPGYRGASDATCVTGGWAACFPGTRPRASGWGCEAVVAEAACTGATREVLGETACAPVGDCDAPFPPASATYFVSPQATADATHFTTLAAAVAAAPAGATIAVDSGSYVGQVLVTKSVTIAGRCPAKVTIFEPLTQPAIRVEGVTAKITGLTVERSTVGVSLGPGSDLTLEDVVLDRNDLAGLSLSDGKAKLQAARVVVRGTRPSSAGDRGFGLNVQGGSVAVVRDATFAGNGGQNVRVSSSSEATLEGVVLRDGKPTPAFDFGRGLQIQDGARVSVTRSAVIDNADIGIVAGDRTTLELRDVVVARTKLASTGLFGRALNAFGGALVRAEGLHLHDNHDASIMVAEQGTRVELRRSSVVDTQLDREGYVGRGITIQEGSSLVAEDVAVIGSHEVGVAVFGAGTTAALRRSILAGTAPNAGDYFGHGAMVTMGGLLSVEDSEIADNRGYGVAVGDGSARLARVRVSRNTVGLYVQTGTGVREVADAAEAPGPSQVNVSIDSVFQDNASRTSAGTVPLPEPGRLAP